MQCRWYREDGWRRNRRRLGEGLSRVLCRPEPDYVPSRPSENARSPRWRGQSTVRSARRGSGRTYGRFRKVCKNCLHSGLLTSHGNEGVHIVPVSSPVGLPPESSKHHHRVSGWKIGQYRLRVVLRRSACGTDTVESGHLPEAASGRKLPISFRAKRRRGRTKAA